MKIYLILLMVSTLLSRGKQQGWHETRAKPFPPCETSPAARCIGVFLGLKCNLGARSQRLKLNSSKANFFLRQNWN